MRLKKKRNAANLNREHMVLLSRLLYITEGKYYNQLEKIRKFRVVLSSGSHETGSRAKKMTASISPYISKVRSHFWLKFRMETSIYGALMLLNFCGDWGRGLRARTKLLGVSN